MSGHAPAFGASCPCTLCQRTRALLEENQRYEKALVEIERFSDSAEFKARIAREALAGDTE